MTKARSEQLLMTPGPVPVPPWVLAEMAQPVIHHRTEEFAQTLSHVSSKLKSVFLTEGDSVVLNSSGTGAMEAAMVGVVPYGSEVLVIESGKFGQRWFDMAQRFCYKAHHIKINWGEDIDLDHFEQLLKENPNISAVFTQACETSTGQLLPVEKISKLTQQHTSALIIVDAITALGCTPLPMDEWGIDVMITGSQKALMLPAGLSLLAASERAWKIIEESSPKQTYYWNLAKERHALTKNQTHFSSAVSLIRPLKLVLDHWLERGLESIHQEIQDRAEHFRQAVLKNGVELFPAVPSPSLTCLRFADGTDVNGMKKKLLKDYNIMAGGGQEHLNGQVLRVGHMGHMTLDDLTFTAQAIQESLS